MGDIDNSGEYNIDIDADDGEITITKADGSEYVYPVEELEGRGIIDNLMGGGASVTVYSQGETYTVDEYYEEYGEQI